MLLHTNHYQILVQYLITLLDSYLNWMFSIVQCSHWVWNPFPVNNLGIYMNLSIRTSNTKI